MLTKKIIVLLLGAAVLGGCLRQETSNVTISGQIKNASSDSAALMLIEDINRGKERVIREIPIDKNGDFNANFSDLEPNIYSLKFGENEEKRFLLAIDSGQTIRINGDLKDSSNVKIEGSKDTELLQDLKKYVQEMAKKSEPYYKKLADLEKETNPNNLEKKEELLRQIKESGNKDRDEVMEYIISKMGNSVAIYATTPKWIGGRHIPALENIVNNFEKTRPDLPIIPKIKEKIKIIKSVTIGGKVADIESSDKDGKKIKLSSVRGDKYTLVNFWSSWCGPCRSKDKVEVLSYLYKEYKDKGFEIYDVSVDEDKDKWIKAIEEDGRIWIGVSDLEGFFSPTPFNYSVTGIPDSFLINSEGILIAKTIDGKELKNKVEELFKQ